MSNTALFLRLLEKLDMIYALLLGLLLTVPSTDNAPRQTAVAAACSNLALKVHLVPTSSSQFRVTVINNGSGEVVIEKSRLAATYRIEEFNEGKWGLLISSGIGRGVSSSGAKAQSVCEPVDLNQVGLGPDEHFSLVADLGNTLADLPRRAKRRVTFVYTLPEDEDGCTLTSNTVSLIL